MDFSGFGHLFATQLSYDSYVAFFDAYIPEMLTEWRMIFYGKQLLVSDQDAPQRKGL